MSQLKELSKPFDARLIEQKGGHGYVNHASVTERGLATVGPYSQKVEQLIVQPDGTVSGALVTISCEIDGRIVSVTEAGETENPTSKTNGAKTKDAISDAVKRCWMRLGLGLHLWSQKHYVLDRLLERNEAKPIEQPVSPQTPVQETPKEPVEAEPTLSIARAKAFETELEKVGYSWQGAMKLAEEIAKRNVEGLTDLTESEALAVWNVARRKSPKPENEQSVEAKTKPTQPTKRPESTPPAANPIWMGWRKSDDAVLWAGDQVDADSSELFGHLNHAQNSFTKAKDEYTNSLTDAEKPKPDDSHETKWAHARALFKYFYERTEAKKRGETLLLPTAGSQRIFEPFGSGESVGVEALS